MSNNIEKLTEFLLLNNCEEQYWENVGNDRFYPRYSPAENSSMCPNDYLDAAFVWSETKQGRFYWAEICHLWKEFLTKQESSN